MSAAITRRLDKLEQASTRNDGPGLHFTGASETGSPWIGWAGFDSEPDRVFEPLPNETHDQTLRRACDMALRSEIGPFITSYIL